MVLKAGQRLYSTACNTQVVVVRCDDPGVVVECGGRPMVDEECDDVAPVEGAGKDGTLLGKRYSAAESGLELLCVHAGTGTLSVNGVALTLRESKPLPASD